VAGGVKLEARLWRVRRRRDHIDAWLDEDGREWTLHIARNDRSLIDWRFATRESAIAEADARRRELQRAGWHTHW
jgi:hypothetical protein